MGIKSFLASRKKTKKATAIPNTPIKVSDYMTTNLITFKPDQRIEQVIDAIIKHRISGGPVINEKNELIGVISEGDCIKQISESRYYNMPMNNDTVEKHMVKNVETIDGNMNILMLPISFSILNEDVFLLLKTGSSSGR